MFACQQRSITSTLVVLFCFFATAASLRPYGHAYGVRPHDFTPDQYEAIASRFEVFTVEKFHAADVYGNASAPAPFKTNSYAATVGSARKIKDINGTVKVLMYWNAALHFNLYECEAEVQPSWVMDEKKGKPPYYNYSVPEFRSWWVRCAIDSVKNSSGALDGLFLDATPKVDVSQGLDNWVKMVREVKAALGSSAVIMDNGFYLQPSGNKLAGEDAWAATQLSYTESMSTQHNADYILWVASEAQQHPFPGRNLIGHGGINVTSSVAISADGVPMDPVFVFGLCKYLLVTSSMANGWFLANEGYSIVDGLLLQPMSVFRDGIGCGEPTGMVERVGGAASSRLRREFEHGSIVVDLDTKNATISC